MLNFKPRASFPGAIAVKRRSFSGATSIKRRSFPGAASLKQTTDTRRRSLPGSSCLSVRAYSDMTRKRAPDIDPALLSATRRLSQPGARRKCIIVPTQSVNAMLDRRGYYWDQCLRAWRPGTVTSVAAGDYEVDPGDGGEQSSSGSIRIKHHEFSTSKPPNFQPASDRFEGSRRHRDEDVDEKRQHPMEFAGMAGVSQRDANLPPGALFLPAVDMDPRLSTSVSCSSNSEGRDNVTANVMEYLTSLIDPRLRQATYQSPRNDRRRDLFMQSEPAPVSPTTASSQPPVEEGPQPPLRLRAAQPLDTDEPMDDMKDNTETIRSSRRLALAPRLLGLRLDDFPTLGTGSEGSWSSRSSSSSQGNGDAISARSRYAPRGPYGHVPGDLRQFIYSVDPELLYHGTLLPSRVPNRPTILPLQGYYSPARLGMTSDMSLGD